MDKWLISNRLVIDRLMDKSSIIGLFIYSKHSFYHCHSLGQDDP